MKKTFICVVCLMVLLPFGCALDEPNDYCEPHNSARADVGVPPLQWNDTLATIAAMYLQSRDHIGCDDELFPIPNGIIYGVGYNLSIPEAVDLWVLEKVNYNYTTNSCSGGPCTAYTQVVWNTTIYVGCYTIQCTHNIDTNASAVACVYSPPGNLPGVRPY